MALPVAGAKNVGIPLLFWKTKLSLINVLTMERFRQLGIEDLAKHGGVQSAGV